MKLVLTLLVVALLAFAVVPMVLADGDDIEIPGDVDVTDPDPTCYDPEIYVDHTARGWYPNDQTYYTANYYGTLQNGGKYGCGSAYDRYAVSERQNYVFEGETVDYYILVRDLNGKEDIDSAQLKVDNDLVGACAPVNSSDCDNEFIAAAFGVVSINTTTDQVYICKLIVPQLGGTWANGEKEVRVKVVDGALDNGCTPVEDVTEEADLTFFNPTLSLEITRGSSVNFGTVTPGSIATSNSIYLANVVPSADQQSGVVMDMYIASDDYFTDPSNGAAICPTGNGIKYDRFSYYATKGSINSGMNDNSWYGVGKSNSTGLCKTNQDEFTNLTSHSGNIGDMCRVINWAREGSFLTQGAEMSITFRLNVPNPCSGHFTNGQFYFVGKII
jgi:hypothetical protein